MDKFTELYNYLKEEGLTDLSAEEFKTEYAAGTAKNTELYSYLKSEKLTDLDAEKFNLEYFPGVEKKKSKRHFYFKYSRGYYGLYYRNSRGRGYFFGYVHD